MMGFSPLWRSLLFVPAHERRFVEKAAALAVDGVILDLEDAVPAERKAEARAALPAAVARLREHPTSERSGRVLVRVNATPEEEALDVEVAVIEGVTALVVPKASARRVAALGEAVARSEREHRIEPGTIRLLAQVEDVQALSELDAIATSSERLVAMTLGSEDFSVSAGMTPTRDTLLLPSQLLVFACRRAGIEPIGYPFSIAAFRDVAGFEASLALARQLGFVGGCCIHPSQVEPLNRAFTPSDAEVKAARELVDAFDASQRAGRGALSVDGAMVDLPVVRRAMALIDRGERIRNLR